MVIRPQQVEVFESAESPHFEVRAVRHVMEAFPKHSRFLGDAGVAEAVKYGRAQARVYGLTGAGQATLFIDLSLLLGRRFDSDPQLPWAADVLSDTSSSDKKARTLHRRATDYLDLVSGPNNEYIDKAQSRLMNETLQAPGAEPAFSLELKQRLKSVFPEKCLYLGEQGVEDLLRNAAASAARYGLGSPPGVMLFSAIMLMLGSWFDSDPLFSWAQNVLNDRQIAAPQQRIERLHAAGLDYLKQWCA